MGRYACFLTLLLVSCMGIAVFSQEEGQEFRYAGSDATVYEEGNGDDVVRAVMEKLTSVCIFKKDKQMIRTIALAASNDGTKPGTFRPGYHGGIWQVDETVFQSTKDYSLSYLWRRFNSAFNIDWPTVQWRDLRKPLYSALAARLALAMVADENNNDIENSLPWDTYSQANMWIHALGLSGDLGAYHQMYQNAVQQLRNISRCKSVGADIAFVVDGSGSIGSENFQHTLNFVKEVISRLNIGPQSNQVALVQYSDYAQAEFHLNTYSTKEQVLQKISSGIFYQGGGTATDSALQQLHQNVFTVANGARPQKAIPQFAVLFTDGAANDNVAAQTEASRVHSKNITLLSVGIGGWITETELTGYASNPKCQNTYHLQGFADMAQTFAFELEQRSCDGPGFVVPLPVDPLVPPTPITIVLQPGQEQYICFIIPVVKGATIVLNGTSGTLLAYISFSVTKPSAEFYDHKMSAAAGQIVTLYLTPAIITSYVGPLVQDARVCITLAVGSNATATGETLIHEGAVDCGAEERDMRDNDVMTLTSPGFNSLTNQPAGYRGGLNCVWKINTPAWTTLELTVNYFNLNENFDEEPGWNCHEQDKLVVETQGAVQPGGYLCAQRPTGWKFPVTRALNTTFITFTSRVAAPREFGFSVTVRAIGRHRLDCNITEIQLQMQKKFLPLQMPVHRYHLLDTSCMARDGGALIHMNTGYDRCGTIRSMNDENLYFTNQASAPTFPSCSSAGACIDVPQVDIPFQCKLERKVKPLSGVYNMPEELFPRTTLVDRPLLEGNIDVAVKLDLARDIGFSPAEIANPSFHDFDFQGNRVYFRVEGRRRRGSATTFVVQADQCWTTPTPDKNNPERFDIVLNGCPVYHRDTNLEYKRHDGFGDHQDVFSVKAVYLNETRPLQLHFHCIARVCNVGLDHHLCNKGCVDPVNLPVRNAAPVTEKSEAAMQRTAQLGYVSFGGKHAVQGELRS
ncbi:uncharacterized protein LOC129590625 [Paramacrobiotus metropolitanus]|uniref:uncharacterized protein LOC129590625 n=1 Tax=Paramacrobiotus metropolitanus TaxID=2943436 RepID=UPI00244645F9|nr:uncharacterized protein LOC129590625 [Paramacrobiotus metropolitanus]